MRATLPSCIESVFKQSSSDFEHLILDDGSADGSWEYLNNRLKGKPMVRLFRNKKNRGLTDCRNFLLKQAQGRYLSILDADDSLFPQKTERHARILGAHPEIGVVWGKSQILLKGEALPSQMIPPDGFQAGWDLTSPYYVVHSSTTWRKETIERAGGYDPRYVLVEGPDLFLKVGDFSHQYYDPHLACLKRLDSDNVFRQALDPEKRAQLSRELFLNTLRRRHHLFLDGKLDTSMDSF